VEAPTLDDHIKGKYIELLSLNDDVLVEKYISTDHDTRVVEDDNPPEEEITPPVEPLTAEAINSEPLQVVHVVVVDAELVTFASIPPMKTMKSPLSIRIMFQSNLRVSEGDFEWKIEKILTDI
jgi:hypothetical protein